MLSIVFICMLEVRQWRVMCVSADRLVVMIAVVPPYVKELSFKSRLNIELESLCRVNCVLYRLVQDWKHERLSIRVVAPLHEMVFESLWNFIY